MAVKSTHNTRYLAGAWAAGMGKTLLGRHVHFGCCDCCKQLTDMTRNTEQITCTSFVDSAVEHTINRSQFGKKLHNYGLIQVSTDI